MLLSKTMFLIDVIRVQPLPNPNLQLTFENGFQGIVEMDRIVKKYNGVLGEKGTTVPFKSATKPGPLFCRGDGKS